MNAIVVFTRNTPSVPRCLDHSQELKKIEDLKEAFTTYIGVHIVPIVRIVQM